MRGKAHRPLIRRVAPPSPARGEGVRAQSTDRTSGNAALAASAGLIVFAAALWAPQVLNDGDSWWHVAAGRLMIARHALITADPFSYTFPGKPWLNHEWLADVLLGGAFNAGGWSGVMLLTAGAAGLTAWLLARDVGRWLSGLALAVVVLAALSLVGPHLLARPHMLALPLLEVWTAGLIVARAQERAPKWALLPVMALWANLHGSFFFGLGLVGVFALEALITAPREARIGVAARWGAFGLAALAMALATPHGVAGLLLPLNLSGMGSLGHIGEWAAADFSRPQPLAIALALSAYAFLTRPVRPAPLRGLLLVVLVFMALQHIRHEMLLGVVGALILAEPLARGFGQPRLEPAGAAKTPALPVTWTAFAAAAVLLLGVARLAAPVIRVDGPAAPIAAVNATPAALRAMPVLNDYAFGGYLIARGVKVFIDSRADMYGDRFVEAYAKLARGDADALARVLRARGIAWTLLVPGTPLERAMARTPGWRRLYADRWAVVDVREDLPPATPAARPSPARALQRAGPRLHES